MNAGNPHGLEGRPKSIRLFDELFLSARLVSALLAIQWQVQAYLDRETDSDLSALGTTIYLFLIFSPLLLVLGLWFFVSRKASRVAKWLLILFVAYEAVAVATNWLAGTSESAGAWLVLAAVVILDIAAIAMLWRADARSWFKRGGQLGAQTFE